MAGIELLILISLAGVFCGGIIVMIAAVLYVWGRVQAPSPSHADEVYPPPQRPRYESPASAAPPPADPYITFNEPPPGAGSTPWLEGIGGSVAGKSIILKSSETLLGRSRVSDLQLDDPKISRQHAMVRLYHGRYFVQDMQSSRGTWVNGQRIETHELKNGDEIRVGDSVFRFRQL